MLTVGSLVHDLGDVTLWQGDARTLPDWLPEKVDAVVTSPPYWQCRDYDHPDQLGLEPTVAGYAGELADMLDRIGRASMVDGGSMWVNLGDVYGNAPVPASQSGDLRSRSSGQNGKRGATSQPPHRPGGKGLALIPERFAIAMSERGWMVRNRVVWHKSNGMPSPVKDRLACKWEHLFHLVRTARYFYDLDAIRQPHADISVKRGATPFSTRYLETDAEAPMGDRWLHPLGANPGDVWTLGTSGIKDAHFAPFPVELVRRPLLATVPEGGTVLDPFVGSGTTCVAARLLGRQSVGVDLNRAYLDIALRRLQHQPTLSHGETDAFELADGVQGMLS